MSTPTPAASSPDGSSPAPAQEAATNNVNVTDKLVRDYLRSRGYAAAEKLLRDALDQPSPTDQAAAGPSTSTSTTITPEDLVKSIAVYAQKPSRPGENALRDSTTVLQELGGMGNPPNIQNLIASIGPVGSEEILSLDPTDKQEGFRELEGWVEGSLDMYKVRA